MFRISQLCWLRHGMPKVIAGSLKALLMLISYLKDIEPVPQENVVRKEFEGLAK